MDIESDSPPNHIEMLTLDAIAVPLLDAIFNQVPVGITIASAPDVAILRVSNFGSELIGQSRNDLEHITADKHVDAYRVFHPVTRQLATQDQLPLTRATQTGETVKGEEWLVGTKDGRLVPILCNAGPIRDDNGALVGGIIAWADISHLKQLEEQLQAAIAERDAARVELNHRVKNHLALVSAMVNLEARGRGEAAAEVAKAIGLKVKALATIYSVLEAQPKFSAPAADLLRAVAAPLATPSVAIEVTVDADLSLPAGHCSPVGIIVNEAVCNALKHGYPDGRCGRIIVSLKPFSDGLELAIANDGLPLPSSSERQGRGSTVIARLAQQLMGTVTLANTTPVGVVMTVRFARQPPSPIAYSSV
jgi:PAS domain S-box-containing protein